MILGLWSGEAEVMCFISSSRPAQKAYRTCFEQHSASPPTCKYGQFASSSPPPQTTAFTKLSWQGSRPATSSPHTFCPRPYTKCLVQMWLEERNAQPGLGWCRLFSECWGYSRLAEQLVDKDWLIWRADAYKWRLWKWRKALLGRAKGSEYSCLGSEAAGKYSDGGYE